MAAGQHGGQTAYRRCRPVSGRNFAFPVHEIFACSVVLKKVLLGMSSGLQTEQFGDFNHWTNSNEVHINDYTGTAEDVTIQNKIGQVPVNTSVAGLFIMPQSKL